MVVVRGDERRIVRVARREPAGHLLVVVEPAQERLAGRHVSMVHDGVGHRVDDVVAALRALGIHAVVGHLGDFGEIPLGHDQDRRGVVGAGDLLAEIRLVVVDVGPAEHVLQHRLLVELTAEVDGLRGLGGIDEHGLAVLVDLAAAIRPQQRVEPAVVVAEAVAQLEAERMPLLLE